MQSSRKNTVTLDSENGYKFAFNKNDGSRRYFQQSKRGLYYFTVHGDNIDKFNKTDENQNTIFNTV